MQILSLNGFWDFRFEEKRFMEDVESSDFTANDKMAVPGCFDTLPHYYCKRGTGLYRRIFELEHAVFNAFVMIAGMGLRMKLRVDGREIGTSALPYSSLEIPTGPLSAGCHTITAAVDNNFDAEKMKLFLPYYDFYAFGGFYHGISLKLQECETALDRALVRILNFRTGEIELEFVFLGDVPENFEAEVRFDRETEAKTYPVSGARLKLTVPNPKTWSPQAPNLHTVHVSVAGSRVSERFGLRQITTRGKQILLNGEPIYLKGFNRHESHPEFGSATPETVMLEDLHNLKSLHCNFIRGSHYPQSQRFLDLCDETGFLVWEESLGWGNTAPQMADEEYCALQQEQTHNMVRTSFNHPSVIIFAFQNENRSDTQEGLALNTRLIRAIKAEDSGRLVAYACCYNHNDISNEETDLIAYNTYPGWINTNSTASPTEEIVPDRDRILNYFKTKYSEEKPILVSEMGTCAIYGQHDRANAQWTEEFQAEYLEHVIAAVFACPEISGLTIWQFTDAKSFLRSGATIRCKPLAQNLAGVYDGYRRPKLAAAKVAELFAAKNNVVSKREEGKA